MHLPRQSGQTPFLMQEEILDDSQPLARTDAELMNDIEAFERDKWQDVQSSKPGELFDWALQVTYSFLATPLPIVMPQSF